MARGNTQRWGGVCLGNTHLVEFGGSRLRWAVARLDDEVFSHS